MDHKFLICLVLSLLLPSSIYSQTNWNVNCNFQVSLPNYDCILPGIQVPGGDENINVIFGGTHQGAFTNQNVTRIIINNGNVNFVLRTAFTTFTNLQMYSDGNAMAISVMRIQANALQGASNLRSFFANNANINNIFATGFQGAPLLESINLQNNNIETVPAGMLNNLANLQSIILSGNRITEIPANFFQQATNLNIINVGNNHLEQLPGGMLTGLIRLTQFIAASNRINVISRNFLNTLTALNDLQLIGNQCINRNFAGIGTTITVDYVRQQLEPCFAGDIVENRNFTMQIRGHITLYREDGTLVGRL